MTREQAQKDYNRGRSQAYRFNKRSEVHNSRKPRGQDDEAAIAESLAGWGAEDPDDVLNGDIATEWQEW